MSYWMSWILKHVDDDPEYQNKLNDEKEMFVMDNNVADPEEDISELHDNNTEMFDMYNNTACPES